METKMYGFSIGEIVENKVEIGDENKKIIPIGTKLRIVDIAPKVYVTRPEIIALRPLNQDNKQYFINLVRANQKKIMGIE